MMIPLTQIQSEVDEALAAISTTRATTQSTVPLTKIMTVCLIFKV